MEDSFMNVALRWGGILAIIVTLMNAVVIMTGMHRNPITGSMIPIALAILVNLVVLFLMLKSTAGDSDYVGQLRHGLVLGAVGGVLVGVGAWILLALVFPHAIAEMREGSMAFLKTAGLAEEQIQKQAEVMSGATPVNQAIPGVLGTFFTSIVGAAIIGAFVRRK
jgi:hypothetical protein